MGKSKLAPLVSKETLIKIIDFNSEQKEYKISLDYKLITISSLEKDGSVKGEYVSMLDTKEEQEAFISGVVCAYLSTQIGSRFKAKSYFPPNNDIMKK